MDMEFKHVFVSGPSRSGTTLLELILSSHSIITITPETKFMQKVLRKKYMYPKIISDKLKNEIRKTMELDQKLLSWPSFSSKDISNIFEEDKLQLSKLIDLIFIRFAQNNNKKFYYIGNKKGLYASGYGSYIKKIFNDAKFVIIVRDPRDVTRSIKINLSQPNIRKAAEECIKMHYHIKEMKKKYWDDVKIIRYEDLITRPNEIIKDLCIFLNVQYEESMLEFYKTNVDGKRLITITKSIHENTKIPLNPLLKDQWKRDCNYRNSELRLIEAINYSFMVEYGYKAENAKLIGFIVLYSLYYYVVYLISKLKIKMLYWFN